MNAPRAALVAIGTELVADGRPDTNGEVVARLLAARGVRTALKAQVPDDEEAIAEVLREAERRFDLVVVTGGLGPTVDDVTREGAARAFGRGLAADEGALHHIEERLRARGRPLTAWSARQARLPLGAEALPNHAGTAPGFLLVGPHGHAVVALPGVPHEMRRMMAEQALPRLEARGLAVAGRPLPVRGMKVAGMTEVEVQERLAGLLDPQGGRAAEGALTLLASPGEITLILRAPDEAGADDLAARARARLGAAVFTENLEEGIESAVGRLLAARGLTVATAESCTAGLLGWLLTRTPGSSAWYLQGWVVYGDRAKVATLGIDPSLLAAHGAVSAEASEAMASEARRRSGADLGVAVTGIAGPGGGTAAKPVGLVFIALASARACGSRRLQLDSDRDAIRMLAARAALTWVRRALLAEGDP